MGLTRKLAAVLAAVPFVLAGCSSGSASSGGDGYGYSFALISHGSEGDSFWTIVKNGAEQAGKDLGVEVTYQNNEDPAKQSQLIDAAVGQKVDGIIVSMANPDALQPSIRKAVQAKIPVVTINSGQDRSHAVGAIAHVGQDETVAGQAAGQRLKDAGLHHVICVIHEAGNVGLEQRCKGAADTFGGRVENLQVTINDLPAAQATVKSKLLSDPSVDGVLALQPTVGTTSAQAVTDAGSKAKVATFDLSGDVANAVRDGQLLFAVDQQPYLQGYLPVQMLTLFKSNLNIPGGDKPILTGPSFVTKDNAAKIADLAKDGRR